MSERPRELSSEASLPLVGRHHTRVTRFLQGCLVLALGIGALEGNVSILVNAAGGLAVTFVPALLDRSPRVPMDSRLSLWLTSAVFLHVVGALGLPGIDGTLYSGVWWWDHVTHAASASLIAGIGYGTLRAVDDHSDAVDIPPKLMVVYTLLFVLAIGVYWELFEFAIGHLRVDGESALTQYGVEDTLGDLAFDAAGGLIVAVLGEFYALRTGGDSRVAAEAG